VGDGLTPQVLADVRAMPGVALAETATTLHGRVRIGPSDYVPLVLFSRTDFVASTIAKLTPQSGAWPPPPGGIVIERAATGVARTQVGATVELTVSGGRTRTVPVAGTVHDLGQAPAWQEGVVYGYVTPDTLARLGYDPRPTELRIVVAGDRLDRAHIDTVATTVADRLRARGVRIDQVLAREPGVHPHQTQMDSLLWLQKSFGALALVLSALLVATLMTALLAGEARQIGALKAVGARTGQIAGSYAGMVTVLGLISLVIGWPLGRLAADAYITAVTATLNFDITDRRLSVWLVLGQLAIGLAVPLVAAAFPVLRAARATAASAMRDHGVTAPATRADSRVRSARIAGSGLPRIPLMAGRNVFRRRARLVVTMTALALGGSTFIAALNLSASLNATLDGQADALTYGIAVDLTRPYPADQVDAAVRAVPGIAAAETWLRTPVAVGDTPTAKPPLPYLYGVPADTTMLALPVLSGRWLTPGDDHGIVISHNLAKDHPDLKVGTDVRLRIRGRLDTWHVVGIVRQVAAPPAAWTTYDALAGELDPGSGTSGSGAATTTDAVRVKTSDRDPDSVLATRKALDEALTTAGINVATSQDTARQQQVLRDHILVITTFLGLLTLLCVLIGGLGLATTMAINVIERTREIGVLRAVGATTAAILTLVVVEGGIVGALSWLAALVLAVPASILFGQVIGEILVETPLDLAVSGPAPFVWLAVVVVLSALASFTPARRAAALTVRDALAYQ
jgi:putative ABC transport system permease protein